MKKNAKQYTIRNVPEHVDRILRQRARDLRMSFNQVAIAALVAGTGATAGPGRDLSGIFGCLTETEADALDAAIREQHQVDPGMWE